jgi:hypothetical protein
MPFRRPDGWRATPRPRSHDALPHRARSRAPDHCGEPLVVGRDHCGVTIAIGTAYRNAQLAELGEQQRRGVAVVVVQPDRDDAQLGVHRCEEPGVGVRAAVVRDLEHIRADIDARVEHRLLFFDLGVTGQQHPHALDGRSQDHRGIVRIRPRAPHRHGRGEYVQVNLADIQRAADDGGAHLQPVVGQQVADDLST